MLHIYMYFFFLFFVPKEKSKFPGKKNPHHAVSPPASTLVRSSSVMVAGKRNRKCCECHLLRLDRGNGWSSCSLARDLSARWVQAVPPALLLYHRSLVQGWGRLPSLQPAGKLPPQQGKMSGGLLKRNVCVCGFAVRVVSGFLCRLCAGTPVCLR